MTDRHLTKDEQKAMRRALRRSTKPVDLRAKSDALLERCGWRENPFGAWYPPGKENAVGQYRPHPYANAQDAIDLAEAMGLRVVEIGYNYATQGYATLLHVWSNDREEPYEGGLTAPVVKRKYWQGPHRPTIAEAICAAIEEALGDPA